MPKILAIHGIGQQFNSAMGLAEKWWPEIKKGLELASCVNFGPDDLACPYYADLFLNSEELSTGNTAMEEDMDEFDLELIQEMWEYASICEPDRVISPKAHESEKNLVRYPRFIQNAANGLLNSRYFSGITKGLLLGNLKQVNRYINDIELRHKIVNRVTDQIDFNTKVVIGHSLGSVVAYEALCRCNHKVETFITLGSPLGIKKLIFDRLEPTPENGLGKWPNVKNWLNVADKGDLVAMNRLLSGYFGDRVKDVLVNNGSNAHDSTKYMGQNEVVIAIANVICQEN